MSQPTRPAAWVATIAPEDADGVVKEAYDWQSVRLDAPAELTQVGEMLSIWSD
jgi:hypothetical protein